MILINEVNSFQLWKMHYSNFRRQTYCFSKFAQFFRYIFKRSLPLSLLWGYNIDPILLCPTGAHGSFARDIRLEFNFWGFFPIQFPCCRLGKQSAANSLTNVCVCVWGGGGWSTLSTPLAPPLVLGWEEYSLYSKGILFLD